MKYKVLLVDDEPMVLSGIKFLIDWGKLDCKVTNTARNGKQALEIIEMEKPDIVLCDINMPVLSGLEVLKAVSVLQDAPVFIMLTNHQEFDMARESLRYKAVEYLLKNQLEAEVVERAVQLAIEECNRRNQVAKMSLVSTVIEENKTKVMRSCIHKILEGKITDKNNESYRILEQEQIFSCFSLVEVLLDFSVIPMIQDFSIEDKERIFECEHEILVALLSKLFENYTVVSIDHNYQRFTIFIWNVEKERFQADVDMLYTKLVLASANVTRVRLSVLVGGILEQGDIFAALSQIKELQDYYYYQKESSIIHGHSIELPLYEELKINPLINKLVIAIRSKNTANCIETMRKIRDELAKETHHRKDGIANCADLYSTICMVIIPLLPEDTIQPYFMDISGMLQNMKQLLALSELQQWLEEFERQVMSQMERFTFSNSEMIDRVRGYIMEHVQEKLMLQNIAAYANVSPSYLSALFKKHCNQNLVDYINEVKMEKACELIREGKYKIYEISYLMSFDNAYYFTKVFKRYKGMTPKEYQHKIRGK